MRPILLLAFASPLLAQQPPARPVPPASPASPAPLGLPRQTDADAYTRYELLAPGSAKFRIIYEITATTPGATAYFNPIRMGSTASDESVIDRATGKSLAFVEVGAAEARAGGVRVANDAQRYIKVTLGRPVPASGGEQRILILKTYEDTTSYFLHGDTLVFTRPLGIKRNAVVLPAGSELVACNVPSQVLAEADGRLKVSFLNISPGEAPLLLKARPLPAPAAKGTAAPAARAKPVTAPSAPAEAPSMDARLTERAHEDREIVYFLQQPETHAFALYHDYTESRPGIDAYYNVVRTGSRVSSPSARLLDTGEALKVEMVKGASLLAAKIDVGDVMAPDSVVVVIRFPAVQKGRSARLRIIETYTDEQRYYMDGDELVWDRALGRSRNAVVLPAGWYLTASAIPAVVTMTGDGRVRLEFNNPRPDEVAVLLKARKR
jgi:hypothetical protein